MGNRAGQVQLGELVYHSGFATETTPSPQIQLLRADV